MEAMVLKMFGTQTWFFWKTYPSNCMNPCIFNIFRAFWATFASRMKVSCKKDMEFFPYAGHRQMITIVFRQLSWAWINHISYSISFSVFSLCLVISLLFIIHPIDLLVKTDLPCIQKVLYKPQGESDQPY